MSRGDGRSSDFINPNPQPYADIGVGLQTYANIGIGLCEAQISQCSASFEAHLTSPLNSTPLKTPKTS